MAIKKEYAGAAFTGFIVASLFFCGCKNSLEEKVKKEMIEDKIDYKTLFEPLYQKPIKPGIKIEYYIQMEYKPFIAKNIA